MAGDATPNNQPHLHTRDNGVLWCVRVKDGLGHYVWLTDEMPKRLASRQMRRIREAMVRMWLAAPEETRAIWLGGQGR